ncbi:midnolin-like [Betta splendens]|uniref:Midnolin-like n=1 Tax=Betta splendens TaxID=158456 RepID=A0A6P7KX79_BETSP|nr:midnolin-like [Betta splendens]
MEQQQQQQQQRGARSFTLDRLSGCEAGLSSCQPTMRLCVTSTTGSPVELTVPRGDTVDGLRTRIARNLRLQTEKIVLLHKNTKLTGGKLLDLGLTDGSKVTLVPVIEAGFLCSTNRPQRTVMDILGSLTEVQINDFLSGRSPLNIKLCVGAHMMYVQLELSAQDVEELQRDGDESARSLPATGSVSHPDAGSIGSTAASPSSNTSTPAPKSAACACSRSSSIVPAVNCHQASPRHSCQTFSSPPPAPSLPSACPHPSCPVPVCPPAPSGSSPRPPSPTPASTFTQSNIHVPPTAQLCKQPGAVIESLVNHSPGVFSGTFSGTLAPCTQTSASQPQRGITVILQILNDLLQAAYSHQGAAPTHPQRHSPALNLPVSPGRASEATSRPRCNPLVTQRAEHPDKASGEEENKTLHCKLEHLHFLMHQRRLHRRTRRNSHLSQPPHPYQHPLSRP